MNTGLMKSRKNTVGDTHWIDLSCISIPGNGKIVFCQKSNTLPFAPKRVFYLYDIPAGASRGAHAHKDCHQVLIAAAGSFEVNCYDGTSELTYSLNQPNKGLHIPPGIWCSEVAFSGGAICLVLASEEYLEADYIRCREEFKNWKSATNEV